MRQLRTSNLVPETRRSLGRPQKSSSQNDLSALYPKADYPADLRRFPLRRAASSIFMILLN